MMPRNKILSVIYAVFSLTFVLSACSNGITIDSDDILYVTSILTSEIVLMDRVTGEVLQRLGADQGVNGPDDVAVAPDGTLYWTNYSSGEACRRAGGTTTCQFDLFVSPIGVRIRRKFLAPSLVRM
jgi:DNA-binding beta-propeller fold protein YncE